MNKAILAALVLSVTACSDPSGPESVQRYTALAVGGDHSCAVATDGSAWCWGRNTDGELGTGSASSESTPARVAGNIAFKEITAGDAHTCALTPSGEAYCWGWNAYYQLGVTRPVNTRVPQAVETSARFTAITAGSHHTCGITIASDVLCWGYNRYGQNGNGTTSTTVPPEPLSVPFKATRISAGNYHTCATSTTGVANCWGRNDVGQLGIASDIVFSVHPAPVRTQLRFTSIDGGGTHTCGIANNVSYCWGSNQFGEIGDGAPFKPGLPGPATPTAPRLIGNVVRISAGLGMTCAVESSGATLCWGRNADGQLGIGNVTDHAFPQPVYLSPNTRMPFGVLAAGGNTHTCGLKDGLVYCWGSGPAGQLGAGESTYSILPQRVR